MSVREDVPEIVSEFPAPPKFFELYAEGVESGPLPPEPMDPTYHMFGSPYSTMDAVPDLLLQQGRKLYMPPGENGKSDGNPVDYKAEMKNEKLDDIELLFLNMHNIINAFRPHQARETVIQMLKTQVQERRNAARNIRCIIDESRQAVERVHGELHHSTDDSSSVDEAFPAGSNDEIKIDDVGDPVAMRNGNDIATDVAVVKAAVLTSSRQDQVEKSRKAWCMQEQFFAALEAAIM
ncbi:hypothetical protein CCR75_004251 [Bremia lactucae]|uniref:Mediator of RNA polymerase II transcription subunit 7 n=1 Tax=Bremia lactucae TaxID=4779 RepID=A0A976FIU2_BRELC|nr:hypothetical protein CCR75_004251 [Bremia lactucae]